MKIELVWKKVNWFKNIELVWKFLNPLSPPKKMESQHIYLHSVVVGSIVIVFEIEHPDF